MRARNGSQLRDSVDPTPTVVLLNREILRGVSKRKYLAGWSRGGCPHDQCHRKKFSDKANIYRMAQWLLWSPEEQSTINNKRVRVCWVGGSKHCGIKAEVLHEVLIKTENNSCTVTVRSRSVQVLYYQLISKFLNTIYISYILNIRKNIFSEICPQSIKFILKGVPLKWTVRNFKKSIMVAFCFLLFHVQTNLKPLTMTKISVPSFIYKS